MPATRSTFETGTQEVRATVDNSQELFTPGYRVRVRVPAGNPYDAVLVPESAINTDQDRKFLLIVDAKNDVKRCDVPTGPAARQWHAGGGVVAAAAGKG